MTITAYFHIEKGYLEQQGQITPETLAAMPKQAADLLNFFGYEHEITAELNLEDGTYQITHLDGRAIAEKS